MRVRVKSEALHSLGWRSFFFLAEFFSSSLLGSEQNCGAHLIEKESVSSLSEQLGTKDADGSLFLRL